MQKSQAADDALMGFIGDVCMRDLPEPCERDRGLTVARYVEMLGQKRRWLAGVEQRLKRDYLSWFFADDRTETPDLVLTFSMNDLVPPHIRDMDMDWTEDLCAILTAFLKKTDTYSFGIYDKASGEWGAHFDYLRDLVCGRAFEGDDKGEDERDDERDDEGEDAPFFRINIG